MDQIVLDTFIANIIAKHTYTGTFKLSAGGESSTYIDCRAAILSEPVLFALYIRRKLLEYPLNIKLVGMGNSGAILLGLMATWRQGYLYSDKGYGINWSPFPEVSSKVILIDDILTTGHTIDILMNACAEKELIVVGKIILKDRSMIS